MYSTVFDGLSRIYVLIPIGLMYQLRLLFLYEFYVWMTINVSGVLESLTIIVLLSVSPSIAVNICFIYLGTMILGTYMFINLITSSCIDPFIII